MIIGRGDIASTIADVPNLDRPDRIYFASGVSNSQETRESEYKREVQLLAKQDPTKHLIYFSSFVLSVWRVRVEHR